MTDPVYREPLNPVLVTPNPLDVSDEQKDFIRAILNITSSDSRFAQKAYDAIMVVLLNEAVNPIILSIDPTEGNAGSVDPVVITITGENFEPASVVLQAGNQIASAYVNPTTLTASVALSGAQEGTLAINVRNSTMLVSNTVIFTVLPPLSANDVARMNSGITASTTDTTNTREVPVATTDPASQENTPVATTEGESTALDDLKAQIAGFNTQDANTQFDAEQSGGTPLEGAR